MEEPFELFAKKSRMKVVQQTNEIPDRAEGESVNGTTQSVASSSAMPSQTAADSQEKGYLQALDAEGNPLCICCQLPSLQVNTAWDTRFCSQRCQEEFLVRSNQSYKSQGLRNGIQSLSAVQSPRPRTLPVHQRRSRSQQEGDTGEHLDVTAESKFHAVGTSMPGPRGQVWLEGEPHQPSDQRRAVPVPSDQRRATPVPNDRKRAAPAPSDRGRAASVPSDRRRLTAAPANCRGGQFAMAQGGQFTIAQEGQFAIAWGYLLVITWGFVVSSSRSCAGGNSGAGTQEKGTAGYREGGKGEGTTSTRSSFTVGERSTAATAGVSHADCMFIT
ncbi:UNVERIFIED_CONTAM: hypothetical protein FKN15_042537 [Acipenser sinensis]